MAFLNHVIRVWSSTIGEAAKGRLRWSREDHYDEMQFFCSSCDLCAFNRQISKSFRFFSSLIFRWWRSFLWALWWVSTGLWLQQTSTLPDNSPSLLFGMVSVWRGALYQMPFFISHSLFLHTLYLLLTALVLLLTLSHYQSHELIFWDKYKTSG